MGLNMLFLAYVGLALFTTQTKGAQIPLTTTEQDACRDASVNGYAEWKKYPSSKLNPESHQHGHELPIALHVYNHSSWFNRLSEIELKTYLGFTRELFSQCDIQVVVDTVKFHQGPSFLATLDHPLDNNYALTDRERCLMGPIHRDNLINIYFVNSIRAHKTLGTAHALSSKAFGFEYAGSDEKDHRFMGAVIIPDGARVVQPKIVLGHEIGHVVFDEGHFRGHERNIMHGEEKQLGLNVSQEQCSKARTSSFVRRLR